MRNAALRRRHQSPRLAFPLAQASPASLSSLCRGLACSDYWRSDGRIDPDVKSDIPGCRGDLRDRHTGLGKGLEQRLLPLLPANVTGPRGSPRPQDCDGLVILVGRSDRDTKGHLANSVGLQEPECGTDLAKRIADSGVRVAGGRHSALRHELNRDLPVAVPGGGLDARLPKDDDRGLGKAVNEVEILAKHPNRRSRATPELGRVQRSFREL